MQIIKILQNYTVQFLNNRYAIAIEPNTIIIQPTNKDHAGDFTIVLFPLAKYKIGKLEEIGIELGKAITQDLAEQIVSFELIKGFLNLTLTAKYWLNFLYQALSQGEDFFNLQTGVGQHVMLEICSPNTNKPLHLGHLRNIFLGDSLARILKQAGFRVTKACLFNDKGIHICKSMIAYQRVGAGITPESSGIKGDHLVGDFYVKFNELLQQEVKALIETGMTKEEAEKNAPIAQAAQELYRQWEAGEPQALELWNKMNQWVYDGVEQTFKLLGIEFDQYYYESDTYKLGKEFVEEGLNKGIFFKKPDGSVWIDLTPQKLDEKVLLRSDGTSVYITQDIGTAELKYQQYKIDKSIYVVGNEQDYHFKVLFEILKQLERPYANGLYHLSYGMVELPTGKMKSREGTVVDADDLIQELFNIAEEQTIALGKTQGLSDAELQALYRILGLGAIKYYLLKVDPIKKILFNPAESIDFKGHTGTFIQFTYARSCAILRKAAELLPNLPEWNEALALSITPNTFETDVIQKIHAFPRALQDAAAQYSPALLAQYVYELAREYSSFYYEVPILQADQPETIRYRIALTQMTNRTLQVAMNLLGIIVPERM